jgi:hypothetical protein
MNPIIDIINPFFYLQGDLVKRKSIVILGERCFGDDKKLLP